MGYASEFVGRSSSSVNSAAGAALTSRGRKAVDQAKSEGLRPDRAGIALVLRELHLNVAPSALAIRFSYFSAALRPWLLNAGPSDLYYILRRNPVHQVDKSR